MFGFSMFVFCPKRITRATVQIAAAVAMRKCKKRGHLDGERDTAVDERLCAFEREDLENIIARIRSCIAKFDCGNGCFRNQPEPGK